mmetsp:Transcript_15475/g.45657  ORF Transcript_15475/g.45657 Transcript_15475/m.45657 type:complete len:268 (-) Transcript_15475:3602-4405(-)
MNSARLSSAVTVSGGMVGDASAASRLRTSCSCKWPSSSAQHDTKPAANSSRAMDTCTCASSQQARSAGDALCLSSSTLKLRCHSAQSSLVTRWLLSHARRSAGALTGSLPGTPAAGSAAPTGAPAASSVAHWSSSVAQLLWLSQSSASDMHMGSVPHTPQTHSRSNQSCEMRWRCTTLRIVGTNIAKSCPSTTAIVHSASSASRRSSSCGPSSTLVSGCSTADAWPESVMRGIRRRAASSAVRRTSSGMLLCPLVTKRTMDGSSRWR